MNNDLYQLSPEVNEKILDQNQGNELEIEMLQRMTNEAKNHLYKISSSEDENETPIKLLNLDDIPSLKDKNLELLEIEPLGRGGFGKVIRVYVGQNVSFHSNDAIVAIKISRNLNQLYNEYLVMIKINTIKNLKSIRFYGLFKNVDQQNEFALFM